MSRIPSRRRKKFALITAGILATLFAAGVIVLFALAGRVVAPVGDDAENALAHQSGAATNILLVGSDARSEKGTLRGKADSIQVMRFVDGKPPALLWIPRNLAVRYDRGKRVAIEEISTPLQSGGLDDQIDVVERAISMKIHHVAVINFFGLRRLIDAVGGLHVTNPEPITTNIFHGRSWNFAAGRIPLNGQQAMIYARVRENKLNKRESDSSRGARQQQVMEALVAKVANIRNPIRLVQVAGAADNALISDMGAWELFRTAGKLHENSAKILECRLGGTFELIDSNNVQMQLPDLADDAGGFLTVAGGGLGILLVADEHNGDVLRIFRIHGKPRSFTPKSQRYPVGCTVSGVPR